MSNRQQWWSPHLGKLTISSCCTLLLLISFLVFPVRGLAHTISASGVSANGLTLQVNGGFNTRYRAGNWVPLRMNLSNSGADFSGTIEVGAPLPFAGQGNDTPLAYYKQPITLANGAQKQITINLPVDSEAVGAVQTLKIRVLDDSGTIVHSQTALLNSLAPNDVFVGILSDQPTTSFASLYAVPLPSQGGSLVVESLNATTLPDTAVVLRNFDLLILDNFTISTLSSSQLAALQGWVNQGGSLVEVGGPEWHRTLSGLPTGLVPVTVNGTSTLAPGTRLLPVEVSMKAKASLKAPVPVSSATVVSANTGTPSSSTVLAAGSTPLLVEAHVGQGLICYLAYDPTLEPLASWSGTRTLWQNLLVRSVGDRLFGANNNLTLDNLPQTGGLSGLLQNLLSGSLPSPWLLLALLLGYLLILGPLRFLVVRWRKRRDWNWRIILSCIVVFSLLTYGLALRQKGTTILTNSVSVVRFNTGNTLAHEASYISVFVPNEGDYSVHVNGNGLVQPALDQPGPASSSGQTTITAQEGGTDVNLQGVNIWTIRSLLAEQDTHVPGGIIAHLSLHDQALTGTVTNALHVGLSDVYVLLNDGFVALGHLAAEQTVNVQLSLNNASSTTNSGMTLADQIAQSNQLPVPYGQIAGNGGAPPQNELQRHLAILSALSDGGNYTTTVCGVGSCTSVSSGIGPGGFSYGGLINGGGANGSDPLLIAGAPVTLIGWPDTQNSFTNGVTINGSNPVGLQETLVQVPLNVSLSGTLHLPPNFISGQFVDVQGNTLQNQPAGIYSMTTGSVTFEMTIPGSSRFDLSNLTISEPSNLTQIVGSSGSSTNATITDVNRMQASLYNWRTHGWDSVAFDSYSISTANPGAYIGPGGRVLLQLSNSDSSLGTVLFSKPWLDLQGTAH